MHEESGGVGRVFDPFPLEKHLAPMLRRDLKRAGVVRAELFVTDKTREQMTFHDLRSTGITWMAMRGDEPLKIKQRAGHKQFSTTEGYIREAESVREGFGVPFPPLPEGLVSSGISSERLGRNGHVYKIKWENGGGEDAGRPHELLRRQDDRADAGLAVAPPLLLELVELRFYATRERVPAPRRAKWSDAVDALQYGLDEAVRLRRREPPHRRLRRDRAIHREHHGRGRSP